MEGASRAWLGPEDTAPDRSRGCFIGDREMSGPETQPASHDLQCEDLTNPTLFEDLRGEVLPKPCDAGTA